MLGTKRAKREGFVIIQYDEEVRRAQQLLLDGVYEMMNVKQYQTFKGKPEQGAQDEDDAKREFDTMCGKSDSIKDLLGPTPKLARRLAVQEDVNKAESKLQRGLSLSCTENFSACFTRPRFSSAPVSGCSWDEMPLLSVM